MTKTLLRAASKPKLPRLAKSEAAQSNLYEMSLQPTENAEMRRKNICRVFFLLICVVSASRPAQAQEMHLLLDISGREFGWGHNGVDSWGGDWQKRACNEALEEIRTKIASMVNMKELETFTKTDVKNDVDGEATKGKDSASIKIAYSGSKSGEDRTRWVNQNNLLIDVADVRIKPGTDWTKTKKNWKGERSWQASATMTYTLRIYGK